VEADEIWQDPWAVPEVMQKEALNQAYVSAWSEGKDLIAFETNPPLFQD
jgi:hypothetical protein